MTAGFLKGNKKTPGSLVLTGVFLFQENLKVLPPN